MDPNLAAGLRQVDPEIARIVAQEEDRQRLVAFTGCKVERASARGVVQLAERSSIGCGELHAHGKVQISAAFDPQHRCGVAFGYRASVRGKLNYAGGGQQRFAE